MKKNHTSPSTIKISMSSFCLLFIINFLLIVRVNTNKNVYKKLECLLEKQVMVSCVQQLAVEEFAGQLQSLTTTLCPILVKFYHQNQEHRINLYDKVDRICRISIKYEISSGYSLLGLYIMKGDMLKALELQYTLFFNDPFQHEQKINQTIVKYRQFILQFIQSSGENDQIPKAISLFYTNKFTQSLNQLKSIEKKQQLLFPNVLKFLKIRILEKTGLFPEALQDILKFIKWKGDSVHWYLLHQKGNLLMHHLKFKQAIIAFEQALNRRDSGEQHFLFSLYNIGLCYQKLGQYEKSMKYFRMVIEKDECAEALNSLAFSFYSLVDKSKQDKKANQYYKKSAQKFYKRSIKANNYYYPAYYNFGLLLYQQGMYQQSGQLFKKSIQSGSGISSKYALFKALFKINKTEAMQYLQKKILTQKQSLFYDIGVLFYQLEELLEAKRYLQLACQQKWNLGEVLQWKGLVEFQLSQFAEAQQSFRGALQSGNVKGSIWFNLGYLQQRKKNWSKALGLYKKAVEKDRQGPGKEKVEQLKKLMEDRKQQL